MTVRQPRKARKRWPKIWLMTDARFGNELLPAIRRLPFGSGVVFRHYELEPKARRKLFDAVRRVCRQRGHMLILGSPEILALRWRADGFHGRKGKRQSLLPRSAPVHDRSELLEALRNNAGLLFVSPLFPTASHAEAKVLGRPAFNTIKRQSAGRPVIALGGVTRRKAQTLPTYGWAAIDAFRKNA
jgi:thiamine-phosphate pyrophosphorylase